MFSRMLKFTTIFFMLIALFVTVFVTVDESSSIFIGEEDGVLKYKDEKCLYSHVPTRELKNPDKDKACWDYLVESECKGKKPKFIVKNKTNDCTSAPSDDYYYYTCELSKTTIEHGEAICGWSDTLQSCRPSSWQKKKEYVMCADYWRDKKTGQVL